jgi:hypothetical protein
VVTIPTQVSILDRTGTALLALDGMRRDPAEVAQRALDTLMGAAPVPGTLPAVSALS